MRQEIDQGFESKLGIRGLCHVQLFGPDGNLKEERFVKIHKGFEGRAQQVEMGLVVNGLKEERIICNTITELMDVQVADQMADQGQVAIGWMAVGTSSGQISSDVGLAVSLDRNVLTSTTQGSAGADNDVVYVGDWAAGDATGAITEAGIMQADDNASMMTYADFSVINKGAADTLQITWTVTFGAS